VVKEITNDKSDISFFVCMALTC